MLVTTWGMTPRNREPRAFRRGVLVALALLTGSPTFAATLTVTTLADHGPGSLRSTIAAAAPGDGVNFAPELSGTIALNSTLTLEKSLVINGDRRITLDGRHATRVLRVLPPATAYLFGLTVQHGLADTGAGILNEGWLELTNCVVRRNHATGEGGGIAHQGSTLAMTDSDVIDNEARLGGGGVLDAGHSLSSVRSSRVSGNRSGENGAGIRQRSGQILIVEDSKIIGNHGELNSTAAGGGISVEASELRVRRSEISGNNAYVGGGIYARTPSNAGPTVATIDKSLIANNTATYDGGGVAVSGADVTIRHTTISQNLAVRGFGGGILAFGTASPVPQQLVLAYATIALNDAPKFTGGGIAIFALPTRLFFSLIADNSASADRDIAGGFLSGGYNLVTDRGTSTGYVDTDLPNLTPARLATLFHRGGATSAHDLLSNSPAIDAIPLNRCIPGDTDQRDLPRPSGIGCDIGAIEFQVPPPR